MQSQSEHLLLHPHRGQPGLFAQRRLGLLSAVGLRHTPLMLHQLLKPRVQTLRHRFASSALSAARPLP